MRQAMRWGILTLLAAVGFAAFLLLCGEDNPRQPMGDMAFIGTKLAAGAALYLCTLAGRHLNRRGWLPDTREPEENERKEE